MMLSYRSAVRLRRINRVPLLNKLIRVANLTGLTKGDAYWREERWTKQVHRLGIAFAGKTILSLPFKIEVGDVYLQRTNDVFFNLLYEMIQQKKISEITAESKVFEPGCNVGGVLRRLHRETNCAVVGLDISAAAIEMARSKVFANNPKATFTTGDVLDLSFYRQFRDNHFTHAFCVSHLVHVRNCAEKTAYIEELKRIARNVILYELVDPKGSGAGMQNFEDYEKKYGFELFRRFKKGKGVQEIGVYYYSKKMSGDQEASALNQIAQG